ncbi:MAG TPA: hypothetical protein VMI32_12640 [Candidatus Solibacter sp.]|nr:hypothetical protein [Candidatus Solibacter sp.]
MSGTFTDPPVAGVKDTPTIVALKESMFVCPAGGIGTARSTTINAALPPWLPSATLEGTLLQQAKDKATGKNPQTVNPL